MPTSKRKFVVAVLVINEKLYFPMIQSTKWLCQMVNQQKRQILQYKKNPDLGILGKSQSCFIH